MRAVLCCREHSLAPSLRALHCDCPVGAHQTPHRASVSTSDTSGMEGCAGHVLQVGVLAQEPGLALGLIRKTLSLQRTSERVQVAQPNSKGTYEGLCLY